MDTVGQDQFRYTRVAIILHWAIAAFILFNLGFGYFMEDFPPLLRGIVVPLHFSSGITVLALTLVRIAWRLTHRPPDFSWPLAPWERAAAGAIHILLYVGMLAMPLSGWAIISAHPPVQAATAAPVAQPAVPPPAADAAPAQPAAPSPPPPAGGSKIWGVIPLPRIAPIEQIGATPEGVQTQKALHHTLAEAHELGGFIMIVLLLLHVAGALKHQFIDGKAEFVRMGIGRRA
jgi:cytochrome b561